MFFAPKLYIKLSTKYSKIKHIDNILNFPNIQISATITINKIFYTYFT